MGRLNKGLSENKNRYNYEKVLDADGIPVSGLWRRLNKFYVQASIVQKDKVVQRFLPLENAPLEEIIKKAQEIKLYWSKERIKHKSSTYFSIENFFKLSSKIKPFEENLCKTHFDGATYCPSIDEYEGQTNISFYIYAYSRFILDLNVYRNLNWKNINAKDVEELRNGFDFGEVRDAYLLQKIRINNISPECPGEDLKLIVSELLEVKNVVLSWANLFIKCFEQDPKFTEDQWVKCGDLIVISSCNPPADQVEKARVIKGQLSNHILEDMLKIIDHLLERRLMNDQKGNKSQKIKLQKLQ